MTYVLPGYILYVTYGNQHIGKYIDVGFTYMESIHGSSISRSLAVFICDFRKF